MTMVLKKNASACQPTVGELFAFLDRFAPVSLAEEWDNVGLLCGDAEALVTKALVTLDITSDVVRQAARDGVQLVVSHHPVIFHPLRAVTARGPGAVPLKLAAAGVAAICMHTNLDVCAGGVNDALARALGLREPRVLLPMGREPFCKIVAFVPEEQAAAVREAMARAGAGRLGRYDGCAFTSLGEGTFRPLEGAHPFIGEAGRTETVREARVEVVCPRRCSGAVVAAMRAAHPYEEPAFDVFPDEGPGEEYGLGRVGSIGRETPLGTFARLVKERLGSSGVQVSDAGGPVRRAAVSSGACDGDVLNAARRAGADTFVTGEIKHSLMLEALETGVNVVAAGHYETENVVCPVLQSRLAEAFPNVKFTLAATKPPAATV